MKADRNPSPRVSVFIASYNHARYLPDCLDSILAQTYRDFEIVIVDDGSTDDSLKILVDYQHRYPEILHVFAHPGYANKGISATGNLAISKSKGEYLAWIGSDDVWYADKLEQQVAQLDGHPEFGMVYTRAQFIDDEGNESGKLYGVDITSDPNPVRCMIQSCHPPAMTVVFRRECLDQVGQFDETLVYSDWDLFLRIFAHWRVGFIDRPLAKYRIHASNVSKKIDPGLDLQRIMIFTQKIQEKASSIQGALTQPRNLAFLDLQLAFLFFCTEDQERAICHIQAAFRTDPSLHRDVSFLDDWLNSWKPEYCTLSHENFNFWFISHLQQIPGNTSWKELLSLQLRQETNLDFYVNRGITQGLTELPAADPGKLFSDWPGNIDLPAGWKLQVLRKIYAGLLFESYRRRDFSRSRYYWLKSVQTDPSWLLNRGVWSIAMRSYLGIGSVQDTIQD